MSAFLNRVRIAAGAAVLVGAMVVPVGVAMAESAAPPSAGVATTAGSSAGEPREDVVPGEYIVRFRSEASGRNTAHDVAGADLSSRIRSVLSRLADNANTAIGAAASPAANAGADSVIAELPIIDGFGVRLSSADAKKLGTFADVLSVESNRRIELDVASPPAATSAGPVALPWGLDRIDQRKLPLDGKYHPPGDGSGVTAYVIDQGVWADHHELTGRVIEPMVDFVGDVENPDQIDPYCLGHGTHVAGTIAGTHVGVASKARVQAVRVVDCEGRAYVIDALRGMNWVADHAMSPAVVNMSLGGAYDASIGSAVRYLTARGITVVVSAGNDAADACGKSPASEPTAITVGASEITDTPATFSNFGPCVDLYAPGDQIISAAVTGPDDYTAGDGTSMASPHVAGVAALYLSAHPAATPDAVERAIRGGAAQGVLNNLGPTSPDRLLQVDDLPDPVNRPSGDPVAHIVPPTGNGLVKPGKAVLLDGSRSFDPSGGTLAYQWRIPGERGVVSTKPSVTVTPGRIGMFEVVLTVTNAVGAAATTSLQLIIQDDQVPNVILDPPDNPLWVEPGTMMSWDASGSTDPRGGDLTFEWFYTDNDGTTTGTGPTFSRVFEGRWAIVSVYVTNEYGAVASSGEVNIFPPVTPTTVLEPLSAHVSVGDTVHFDGTQSYADTGPDVSLYFVWTDTVDGPVLSRDATYDRRFDKSGTYAVYLTVWSDSYRKSTKKATVVVSPHPAAMSAMEPERVLDTRLPSPGVPGSLGAGGVARFTVGDIPLSAPGVALNVTAVNPSAAGHLTVYPCGDRPNTSNVNYRAGVTTANAVVSLLGGQHELCVWSLAPTDVVVDVTGYVRADSPARSMKSVRAIDTRSTLGPGGRMRPGAVLRVPVSSVTKVPNNASAVFVNVTAANPAADGHLTVYPCGTVPDTSNVNYRAGITKANMAVLPLDKSGSLCVKSQAESDVVVDVLGYINPGGWASLASARKLDTRDLGPDSSLGQSGAVKAGKMVKVRLGVDPAKVSGVFLTVAAVNPTGDGHLTVFPCGRPPTASALNYRTGVTTSNMVFSKVDDTESVCVWTHATTDLVVDYNGAVVVPS